MGVAEVFGAAAPYCRWRPRRLTPPSPFAARLAEVRDKRNQSQGGFLKSLGTGQDDFAIMFVGGFPLREFLVNFF